MKDQLPKQSIPRLSAWLVLVVMLVSALTTGRASLAAQPTRLGARPSSSHSDVDFRSSPVMLIENAGQWDDGVRFQVWDGPGGTIKHEVAHKP